MSYIPLARKYRPTTFAELVGQDSLALALSNAIRIGREPHGLIFSGVRGVGKTTTARLYAKALNCSGGPTAEPCNTCENCLAIAAGNHQDVLEIDGASNTGVDDVRQLRETIEYVPQRSKYKVYIIDEVHMLSQSAFNALLKTLEEPPSHVVFVFATTELQKVPQTILSRCQTFYLRKIGLAAIAKQLADILGKEDISFEDKAIQIIAGEAAGSMRDALTLLDQAIALGAGEVTVSALEKIFSNLSSEPILSLLQQVVQKDGTAVIQSIESFDAHGVDYRKLVEELAKSCRHSMLLGEIGSESLDISLLGLDEAEQDFLKELYQQANRFDLNRIFRTLMKCLGELTGSHLDRYVVENYLFEWCFDPGLPQLDQLIAGTSATLPKVSEPPTSRPPPPQRPAGPKDPGSAQESAPEAVAQPNPPKVGLLQQVKEQIASAEKSQEEPEAFPDDWAALIQSWKKHKPLQARKLEEAYPLEVSPEKIRFAVCETGFASHSLLKGEEKAKLYKQLEELFGFSGRLEIVEKQSLGATVKADATPEEQTTELEQNDPSTASSTTEPTVELQESLLEKRDREAAERREQLVEQVKNAPVTKELLEVFGGSIEDIRTNEDL